MISIGNYTVREVLMKNRTRVWRNIQGPQSRGGPGGPDPPNNFPRLIEWQLIIISAAFFN